MLFHFILRFIAQDFREKREDFLNIGGAKQSFKRGPCWVGWFSGQHAHRLLRQWEFESRWRQQFYIQKILLNTTNIDEKRDKRLPI